MKKKCELCDSLARVHCQSDQASLCCDCDSKVHGANVIVANHSRTLLCHVCQSFTPWIGSGPKLSPTISVCQTCVNSNGDDDRGGGGGGGEDEDEENQVVPWFSKPPPPSPVSSSSTSEESSGSREGVSRSKNGVSLKGIIGIAQDQRRNSSRKSGQVRAYNRPSI